MIGAHVIVSVSLDEVVLRHGHGTLRLKVGREGAQLRWPKYEEV
jgi:hypothetical protein